MQITIERIDECQSQQPTFDLMVHALPEGDAQAVVDHAKQLFAVRIGLKDFEILEGDRLRLRFQHFDREMCRYSVQFMLSKLGVGDRPGVRCHDSWKLYDQAPKEVEELLMERAFNMIHTRPMGRMFPDMQDSIVVGVIAELEANKDGYTLFNPDNANAYLSKEI